MSFHVDFKWVDPGPSPDDVMRKTMAVLSIETGDTAVTTVRDLRNRRYRKRIVVPLFAVADWLVENWWHLWHEPADAQEQKPGFEERHNLAYAGNGFLLPMLTMAPSSGRIHLRSERWEPAHGSIVFVEQVETYIEAEELQSEFRRIIEAVIKRLRSFADGRDAQRLVSMWNAINSLDPEEEEFSRAAALLGVDPFDVDDSVANSITAFWDRTAPSIREEALASADEHSLAQLDEWVQEAVETIAREEGAGGWTEVRDAVPRVQPGEPWQQGYELAKSVRNYLNLGHQRFDFETDGPFAFCHHEVHSPWRRLEGIVAASGPACVTAPRGDAGKRFLRARALGDFMSRQDCQIGILGSLRTDRQARSRAFAAEFLAPAEVLFSRFSESVDKDETIDKLCREFGVSSMTVNHQINNQIAALVDHF